MAAATTTADNNHTKIAPTTETGDIAQRTRTELVSSIQRGQQMSVDAAQTWVEALSVFPVMDLSTFAGVPTHANVEAATKFVFDVAADLLNAQRQYALQMVSLFAPQISA